MYTQSTHNCTLLKGLMQSYRTRILTFIKMYFSKCLYLTIYTSHLIYIILISLVSQMQKFKAFKRLRKAQIEQKIQQRPQNMAKILLQSCLQGENYQVVSQIFRGLQIDDMEAVIFQVTILLGHQQFRTLSLVLQGFEKLRDSALKYRQESKGSTKSKDWQGEKQEVQYTGRISKQGMQLRRLVRQLQKSVNQLRSSNRQEYNYEEEEIEDWPRRGEYYQQIDIQRNQKQKKIDQNIQDTIQKSKQIRTQINLYRIRQQDIESQSTQATTDLTHNQNQELNLSQTSQNMECQTQMGIFQNQKMDQETPERIFKKQRKIQVQMTKASQPYCRIQTNRSNKQEQKSRRIFNKQKTLQQSKQKLAQRRQPLIRDRLKKVQNSHGTDHYFNSSSSQLASIPSQEQMDLTGRKQYQQKCAFSSSALFTPFYNFGMKISQNHQQIYGKGFSTAIGIEQQLERLSYQLQSPWSQSFLIQQQINGEADALLVNQTHHE